MNNQSLFSLIKQFWIGLSVKYKLWVIQFGLFIMIGAFPHQLLLPFILPLTTSLHQSTNFDILFLSIIFVLLLGWALFNLLSFIYILVTKLKPWIEETNKPIEEI